MASESEKTKWTIKDVLQWTSAYFAKRGISTSRLDAEVLLAHVMGVDRLYLYLNLDRPLGPSERLRYRQLLIRRAAREPISLIIGRKEFWSIPLHVRSGVLIPRPDTEILVEAVVGEIKSLSFPRILEIGVGSGAVSIAGASECGEAEFFACDISIPALDLSHFNAKSAGVWQSVHLFGSDLFSAIRSGAEFDVICSNPPYIPTSILETLDPEINYEPIAALSGGESGLCVIERLIPQAREFLRDEGVLLVEIGSDQKRAVIRIFEDSGFGNIVVLNDLAGKSRVVKGRLIR